MKQIGIRYISILLVVMLLLTLCSCELLANFNGGMTEEDYGENPNATDIGAKLKWGIIAVVLIIVGAVGISAPQGFWQISHGWKYKDTEPSSMALTLNRIGGGLAAFIGVMMLLYTIWN